jgi:uncharacterized membrane protein YoaK (UPF0700 family)
MPSPKPSAHDSLSVGILLSVVGGFLDAYTFVLAGGVFANAQTGNLVLLAIALLDPASGAFLKYLLPMAAFVAGVAVAELLRGSRALGAGSGWVTAVLALEGLWLICVGLFASNFPVLVITCGIAFVAALQVTAFKKLGQSPFSTTMITGNLRSAVEGLLRMRSDPVAGVLAGRYLLVIAGFAVGAALGAVLSHWAAWHAVWAAVVLVAVVMAVGMSRNNSDP